MTSWTLSPSLATESFLSAVMVLVSKNPLGSFIKSCCYFTDTKSSLYEDGFLSFFSLKSVSGNGELWPEAYIYRALKLKMVFRFL